MNRRQSLHLTKILSLATVVVMLSVVATLGFDDSKAFAKKPQSVIEWSNGFPSGEHSTMNIHGKKAGYNCDNSLEGVEPYGNSVFVPLYDTSEINIVSNKRSDVTQGHAIDPCAAPFGVPGNDNDPALYQLPTGEHQVYWRILGKPANGGNNEPSTAMLTFPRIVDQCDFLPEAFADGSIVQSFDPDAVGGLVLIAFKPDEKYVDSQPNGIFDAGDSIYRDAGIIGKVDVADTHLYGPEVLADETVDLVSFDPNVQHEDTTGVIAGEFDDLETVYYSVDSVVSEGDIRLANASSQGLSGDEGADAIDCEDQALVGLGLVNNQGVFDKTEEGLERFDSTNTKGKGKSTAVDITELFRWSGVVCDPSLDTDMDGVLTLADFPGLTEADIESAGGMVDGDLTIDDTEFQSYLATLDECVEYTNYWVFDIADIVLYGFDYVNNGSTLTQMRFYPTATTEFTE